MSPIVLRVGKELKQETGKYRVKVFTREGQLLETRRECIDKSQAASDLARITGTGGRYIGEYRNIIACLKAAGKALKLAYLQDRYADGMEVVDMAYAMKNAYFWHGVGNAKARASYDRRHSAGPAEWDEGGRHYSAEFRTASSRKNVYTYKDYYVDDRKTTLTAIKNSLKRMAEEISALEVELELALPETSEVE